MIAAFRLAVAGLLLVLGALVFTIAVSGPAPRRDWIVVDYGTPKSPPTGTPPRSVP